MNKPAFTDTKGREWFPQLDFPKLRKMKEHGIELGNAAEFSQSWGKLLVDDEKLLEVLWLAVRCEAAGQDDFLAAMNGDTLEAGRNALGEAAIAFARPMQRKTMRQGMEAVNAAYLKAIGEAEENLRVVLADGIERAMERAGIQKEAVSNG